MATADRDGALIRPLGQPGDLGWVVMAHGEVYADEFGWDATFEALVARIVADYAAGHDPAREAAWIAELDDRRVGCIFCVADSGEVTLRPRRSCGSCSSTPTAAAMGSAGSSWTRMNFARIAGYRQLRLWTNAVLVAAQHIYVDRGFVLTHQERHHSFGADLVGQTYQTNLESPQRPQS